MVKILQIEWLFASWQRKKSGMMNIFFERVVFTDKCCVKNNGAVNKHNLHYWAIQNSHWMREQDKTRTR
jgi:hypothetical protein